jgi:hypothetical protein
MLDRLFARPLSLTIAGQEISFNTLKEFDFALSGRTEVPSRKMSELVMLTPSELKREAQSIKAVEKQFVEILSKSIESQQSISQFMRKIDPKVFSQDHNWREIMVALQKKDDEYDELRRVALVKYMQYLTSRQEVIKHTYSVKKLQAKHGTPAEDVESANAEHDGGDVQSALRETVILETNIIQPVKKKGELTRLPKGEAFKLAIQSGEDLEITLSKHPFRIRNENGVFYFVDEDGERDELQSGKNIIGRDTVCNVVVNSAFRDISRLHTIVECLSDNEVRITDLSSHGTFIATDLLERAET